MLQKPAGKGCVGLFSLLTLLCHSAVGQAEAKVEGGVSVGKSSEERAPTKKSVVKPDAAPTVATKAATKQDNLVAEDAQGIKGISPFWLALSSGDASVIARDFDTAILRYQEALKSEPRNAMGHYRLSEAQLAKGQLEEAQASCDAALRFLGEGDASLRAKVLFLSADLAERRLNYADAIEKWASYEAFAKGSKTAKTYPKTATERKERATLAVKYAVDYAEVKERIKKREAELAAMAAKNAK